MKKQNRPDTRTDFDSKSVDIYQSGNENALDESINSGECDVTFDLATPIPITEERIDSSSSSAASSFLWPINAKIVFVIDASANMKPYINIIKQFAGFMDHYRTHLVRKRCVPRNTYVRTITFRDYYNDDEPLRESRFFDMHDETEAQEFKNFINSIEFKGEGASKSVLEALHFAINSTWQKNLPKQRQIIILITNSIPNSLNDPRRYVNDSDNHPVPYPDNIPEHLSKLYEEWHDNDVIRQFGKRLILFVPNNPCWDELSIWDLAMTIPLPSPHKVIEEPDIDFFFHYITNCC